jgi:hypothetical protein
MDTERRDDLANRQVRRLWLADNDVHVEFVNGRRIRIEPRGKYSLWITEWDEKGRIVRE